MHGEVLSAGCAAKYHVGEGCGTDTILMSSGFIPSDSKLNYVIILAMLVLKSLVSSCPQRHSTSAGLALHPLCHLNTLLRLTSSVVLVTSLSSFYLVYSSLTGL